LSFLEGINLQWRKITKYKDEIYKCTKINATSSVDKFEKYAASKSIM
jgi:hypothetical protein